MNLIAFGRYLGETPHVIEDQTGTQLWKFEDVVAAAPGLHATLGKPPEEWDA